MSHDNKQRPPGFADRAMALLERHPALSSRLEPLLRKFPAVNRMIAAETDALLGEYYFDVQIKLATTSIYTPLKGKMIFEKDITRRTS